jgi:Helix-turn-helix domain
LSFMKYLNHYRVERSQVMLVNTDEPMATISQEMGFCDQSYFGTVFRRLVGMTPAAYRRRFRNKNASGRAHTNSTPPVWPAKSSLAGAPRPSTAEINRQLAALHDKPAITQTYFY